MSKVLVQPGDIVHGLVADLLPESRCIFLMASFSQSFSLRFTFGSPSSAAMAESTSEHQLGKLLSEGGRVVLRQLSLSFPPETHTFISPWTLSHHSLRQGTPSCHEHGQLLGKARASFMVWNLQPTRALVQFRRVALQSIDLSTVLGARSDARLEHVLRRGTGSRTRSPRM